MAISNFGKFILAFGAIVVGGGVVSDFVVGSGGCGPVRIESLVESPEAHGREIVGSSATDRGKDSAVRPYIEMNRRPLTGYSPEVWERDAGYLDNYKFYLRNEKGYFENLEKPANKYSLE